MDVTRWFSRVVLVNLFIVRITRLSRVKTSRFPIAFLSSASAMHATRGWARRIVFVSCARDNYGRPG